MTDKPPTSHRAGLATSLNVRTSRDLGSAFDRWLNSISTKSRIAIYGPGSDYQSLCAMQPEFSQRIALRISDSPAGDCITPDKAVKQGPDWIVICSKSCQEVMRRRLEALGYQGRILLLYRNDPEIGALGLMAHEDNGDWQATGSRGQLALRSLGEEGRSDDGRAEIQNAEIGNQSSSPEKQLSSISQSKIENRKSNIPRPRTIRRILLVQPPFDVANERHKKTMPLGLLYIAAALRRQLPLIDIQLIDAHIERLSWEAMRQRLLAAKADVVGISYWSAQSQSAWLISDFIRETSDAWVVHGGVHATLCPDEALQHADYVVAHEGEAAIGELIAQIHAGAPPTDRIVQKEFAEELDSIPFPAWDLLPDVARYDHPMHVVGGRRFPIMGSRGCPFNCTFCSSPLFWQRKVRWRSPANVADEMDAIAQRYGVEQFHFWDDNMVMNAAYAEGLGRELLRRKRAYAWCGLSRASDLIRQAHLLPLLKQAGCVGIEIGIESFTDQVSETVAKGESVAQMRRAVELLHATGIAPLYTHMIFTPGETIASYHHKEQFLQSLNRDVTTTYRSDSALGQLTTPHVKTPFAAEAPTLGQVLWRGPSDSFHHRVNFIPHSLLQDIPIQRANETPDPLPALTQIVQAVYNWTEADMRAFLVCATLSWTLMDGHRSVDDIARLLPHKAGCTQAAATVFCSLAVALWSRNGLVAGKESLETGRR